jgi:hypothetical protein
MRILSAIALASVVLLSGCGDDRFPDYHYKMTVYADGKAFSSVREVRQEEVNSILDSSGRKIKTELSGEAVIMDLGGKTVYALLNSPDNPEYAASAANIALMPHVAKPNGKPLSDRDQAIKDWKDDTQPSDPMAYLDEAADASQRMVAIKGPRDLPRTIPNHDPYRGPRQINTWPLFVTFDDPKDPKTVREVSADDIGVRRVTIEITNEALTTEIGRRMPVDFWKLWGSQHKKAIQERGGFMNPGDDSYFKSPAGKLNKRDFIVGDSQ